MIVPGPARGPTDLERNAGAQTLPGRNSGRFRSFRHLRIPVLSRHGEERTGRANARRMRDYAKQWIIGIAVLPPRPAWGERSRASLRAGEGDSRQARTRG